MDVENKLKAMGLELPAAGPDRPAAPGPAYRGKLGAGLTVEQGYDGARQACLHC